MTLTTSQRFAPGGSLCLRVFLPRGDFQTKIGGTASIDSHPAEIV
jgi:hypothetical protein